jgi:ligand-binding sensor domain-containing protein
LDAVVDPNDPRRIYIASWQSLFELYDKKPVIQYWTENSTLANITQQILVDGLCFDKEGNLWMGNMLSETAVNVKKTDGTWGCYSYPELVNKATLKETFVSSNGFLWFLAPRVGAGVAVIDQRGTPFISSDDKFEFFGSLKDEDGNTVTPSSFRSIAEDKDGAIWIGTSSGPFIVSAPDRIFDSDFRFKRIKITREDNENYADYLLGSDQINAIVVDAGNRKWIGSATSGLYLLSPDGKETLMRFNTDNSPLTSNAIVDLAMNHETGELFVATSAGVFSYMTDASEAQETYNNVTVYPNPVTPDYDGDVVVRGLMENSIVRIADAEGQAVYEGYSNGGTFVWDGRNFNQQRVATGVYFVFATVDDGSQKMVAKVAFVR